MRGTQQRSWWGQAIAVFQLQHIQARTWKDFGKKLREVRKVSKVRILSLLKKKLFSSFSLSLSSLPSFPYPNIFAQGWFLYVSLCSGDIKIWSKVCWNEWKNLDFRIFLFIIWMNTGSCTSLESRENCRELAAQEARAELGGKARKCREADCHREIRDEPAQNRVWRVFLLFRALP